MKVILLLKLSLIAVTFITGEAHAIRTTKAIINDIAADAKIKPAEKIAQAMEWERSGKWDKAEELYEDAKEEKALYAEAVHGLARVKIARKDYEDAEGMLSNYLSEENPFDHVARLLLARARFESDRISEAKADLQVIDNLRKSFAPARELRGQISFAEKDYSAAVEHFTEFLKSQPTDLPARMRRAEAYALMGKHEAAIEDYRAAVKDHPSHQGLRLLLVEQLAATKKHDQAAHELQMAIRLGVSSGDILERLGDVYFSMDKMPQAIEHYEKSEKAEPGRISALMKLARAHLKTSAQNAAENAYKKVLDIIPSHEGAAKELTEMFLNRHQYDRVGPFLKTQVKEHPERSWAVIHYARILALAGSQEKSVDILEDALNKNENTPDVAIELAEQLRKGGKSKVAVKVLQRAEKRHPTSEVVKFNLALVFEEVGAEADAIARYSAIPPHAKLGYKAKVNQALLLERRGELAGSLDILSSITAIDKTGTVAMKVRELKNKIEADVKRMPASAPIKQ